MKLIWTFGMMPELEHLSPDEKSRILRTCVKRGTLVWLWAQSVVLGLLIASLVVTSAYILLTGDVRTGPSGLAILFYFIFIPIVIILWCQMQMHRIRRQLRKAIVDSTQTDRLPVCLNCGYDPRGTASDRCPECNASLKTAHD